MISMISVVTDLKAVGEIQVMTDNWTARSKDDDLDHQMRSSISIKKESVVSVDLSSD